MIAHFSILSWEIPWTEESGKLQSMESQRVRHDLATENNNNNNLPADLLLLFSH